MSLLGAVPFPLILNATEALITNMIPTIEALLHGLFVFKGSGVFHIKGKDYLGGPQRS